MIGPAFLLLVLLAVGGAIAATSRHHPVVAAVDHAPTPAHHVPVVAEALGYIGGILGTVGVVLFASRYWSDAPTAVRLAITGTATAGLVVGGWMVHDDVEPAFMRLRWTLWLAGTVTSGVFAGVLATRVFDVHGARPTVTIVAATMAVVSGALWAGHERPIQQATSLVAACVALGVFVALLTTPALAGATVWAVGVVLVTLGLLHRGTDSLLTLIIGALTALVGALVFGSDVSAIGLPLVCATALALVGLAVMPDAVSSHADRVVCAVVGLLGLSQGGPATVGWFAQDAAIATGVVMWLLGATVLVLAIRRPLHARTVVQVGAGLLVLGGAAVTGIQSVAVATVFGVATSIGFVGLGLLPGRVLMSLLGSAGLLAFVPWTIAHWFPGEDRAPLLIIVSGALLIGIAVLLARQGGRLRHELTDAPEARTSERGAVDVEPEQELAERLVEPR